MNTRRHPDDAAPNRTTEDLYHVLHTILQPLHPSRQCYSSSVPTADLTPFRNANLHRFCLDWSSRESALLYDRVVAEMECLSHQLTRLQAAERSKYIAAFFRYLLRQLFGNIARQHDAPLPQSPDILHLEDELCFLEEMRIFVEDVHRMHLAYLLQEE